MNKINRHIKPILKFSKKMKFMSKNQIIIKIIIQYLMNLMMKNELILINCYGMLKIQIKSIWTFQKCSLKLRWSLLNHQIIYSLYFKLGQSTEIGLNLCSKIIKQVIWKMNLMLIISMIRIMNKKLILKIIILFSKMKISINKF
jgi:hypothetical protein